MAEGSVRSRRGVPLKLLCRLKVLALARGQLRVALLLLVGERRQLRRERVRLRLRRREALLVPPVVGLVAHLRALRGRRLSRTLWACAEEEEEVEVVVMVVVVVVVGQGGGGGGGGRRWWWRWWWCLCWWRW